MKPHPGGQPGEEASVLKMQPPIFRGRGFRGVRGFRGFRSFRV